MDCAKTLMMEKNIDLNYWREAISIVVYTLNHVQVKKGTHSTPFGLWYGYTPNVKYFKVFRSKCYILRDFKNDKLGGKSEAVIFLGYSTRSKAYKCLDINSNKVMESANVNFDEYTKLYEAKSYEIFRRIQIIFVLL